MLQDKRLAVIGVVASVISAFYYLNIIRIMYFDEPADNFDPIPGELRMVIMASGLFVIVFAVLAGPVIDVAQAAASSLF